MCPVWWQFSHLSCVPVWNTTSEPFPVEVSPCLLLHSVLRHEMATFGSRTPPRVPTTGSKEGVGIDKVMTPENCASEMGIPSPVHASLNFCSSDMCAGNVSVPPST